MSTPKPTTSTAAAAAHRTVAGPSTPVNNSNLASISTPKSHPTPSGHGSFASPAQRGTPRAVGTPRTGRSMVSGKTMPGGKALGAKNLGANADVSTTSGIAGASTPALTFGTPGLNFGSPAINLTSPNANGLGTTNMDAFSNLGASFPGLEGGIGMGISLSNLGINMSGTAMSTSASTMGKADEAERRKRLEAVLQTISIRSGRISREGIERLGKRCGLDIQPGEVDELAMAGKNVMVDIKFAPHESQTVDRVDVAFATASDYMTEHAEKAARILRKDLVPPPGVPTINATLDRFADNLGRLAIMDRISTPGASCFDAVFGIYTSLTRLFEHEKKAVEQPSGTSKDRRKVERFVTCKKSGMPQMHARNRVGLSLDYWMDQHLVIPSDPDGNHTHLSSMSNVPQEDDRISNLVIECEPTSETLYPTINITSDWLSEKVEKPAEDVDMTTGDAPTTSANEAPVVDWLEPPPLILPPPESHASQALSEGAAALRAGQPLVRFIARLEPPVAVSLLVAVQIYASVGVDISHDPVAPNTLPSLVLPKHFRPASGNDQFPKNMHMSRTVLNREGTRCDYRLGLHPTRIEVARLVESFPFTHPKQLVAILPVLRQYTLIAKLLQSTYYSDIGRDHTTKAKPNTNSEIEGSTAVGNTDTSSGDPDTEAELAALLSKSSSAQSHLSHTLDVAFVTTPVPQMTVIFSGSHGPKRITFNILLNAEIEILEHNVSPPSSTAQDKVEAQNDSSSSQPKATSKKVKAALAQSLAVCEDLVIWAEWIKSKFP